MDTIIRVFYEGSTYDLELAEDLPLKLDISAIEAGELGSFFGVGSQDFYLPGTKANNIFFQHAYNISQDDVPALYESVTAYIIKKGETVLNGQLQLVEVVSDENSNYVSYKCQLVDSVISFKDQLSSKLIKDANWAPYSHSISSESILQSWNAELNGGAIFYPVAEYGFDNPDNTQLPKFSFVPTGEQVTSNYLNNAFTPLLPLQMLPAVRVKDVIDLMFEQVNFIPGGTFYNSVDAENLYILPKGQEQAGIVAPADEIPTFFATPTFPIQSISSSAYSTIGPKVDYTNVVSNVLNKYDSTNSIYNVLGVGNYTFDASITFFNPVFNTPGQEVTIELTIENGSYPYSSNVIASNKVELTNADGFNSFTLSTETTEFISVPGNEVWCRVNYHYSGSTGPVPDLSIYYGAFQCSDAPQVYDGVEVDMSLQFDQTTKSLDILKGLIQQFNLVLTPDPATERVINIDFFDDWVRDGDLKDWTEKYDTAKRKAVNHTIDEVERTITFKQEDDADRFSKVAIEQVPNLQFGSLEVIADNNLSQGEKTIGQYFAPLIIQAPFKWNSLDGEGNPTWNLNRSLNLAAPALYKLDNTSLKTFKFKPRIGYKTDIPFTNGLGMYLGNPGSATYLTGSYSTLTNVSSYPVIPGSSRDTLFNNSYTPLVSSQANMNQSVSAFNQHWKTYVDSLYWQGSKKLTLDIEFNSNEYQTIKLNDKVFIKDNYYRINKIKGFNVTKDALATVELIKLYPAYFQQNVIATPVPVVPVAPVAPSPPTPAPLIVPVPTIVPVPVTPVAPTVPVPVTPSPASPVPIQPRPAVTIGAFYLTQALGTSNSCAFNTTDVPVYALTTTLSDIGTTVSTIYADPQCTVPFFGNGYYYGISTASATAPTYELIIMGTGAVTSREDCPAFTPVPVSPGEFFRGGAQGNSTNACNDETDQGSLFVPYAPSVEYVQSGDVVYTDAGFTTTFSGSNSWYALSNPSRATAQMAIQVNNFGRVVGRQDCVPLPPAPPPPSPSPAPIVVGTFYLSNAFGTTVGCSSETDGYEVYANTTEINDILSGSVSNLYTDPTLTTGFFGNGYYYGVSDISSGSAKGELVVLGDGFFSVNDVCEVITPAPTSPGQFRRTSNFGSATNTCGELTNDGTLFVEYAPSIGYVTAGDYLYTDAGFTTKFFQSVNSWYGMSDPDTAYTQRAVQVNTAGRVITTSDCVPIAPVAPIPTPAPVSTVENIYLSDTGYTTISGACAHASLDITAYYDANEVSSSVGYPWTNGAKIYQDSNLTIPFTGSFLYWLSRPIINSYDKNNVSTLYIQDDGQAFQAGGLCGVIPPVTSYKMGISVPPQNSSTLACAITSSVEVWSADTYTNLTSGDYLYYDNNLQTPVTGSNYIGISQFTGSLPGKHAFVTNAGNLLNLGTCPPIAAPVTSYEYKATSGFLSSAGTCTDFLDAYTFYSAKSDWSQFNTNDIFYSDANLQTVTTLGGNGLWYGVGTSDMTYPSESILMVGGEVSITASCAGVPTPPPPVPVSQYFQYELYPCSGSGAIYRFSNISASAGTVVQLSGSGAGANCYTINSATQYAGSTTEGLNTGLFVDCDTCTAPAPSPVPSPVPVPVPVPPPTQNQWKGTSVFNNPDLCIYTTPTNYYTTGSINIDDWSPGMRVYSDAGATTEITADNQYFGITDNLVGNATPEYIIYYTQAGGVISVTSCSAPVPVAPSPSPAPVTPVPVTWYTVYNNGGFSTATGCGTNVTNTRFALTSSAHLQDGDVLYTAAGFGTEFDGNNLNFGIGDTASSAPEIQAFISPDGVLSSVTVCPPPPTPTPITVSSYQVSNGSATSGTRCSASLITTVYMSTTLANVQIGDVVWLNSNLTNPIAGFNYYWRLGNGSLNDVEVRIDNGGQITNITNCS